MDLTAFPIKTGACLSHDFIRHLHEGRLEEPALSLGLDHILTCADCQARLSAQMESRPSLYPGLSGTNGFLHEIDPSAIDWDADPLSTPVREPDGSAKPLRDNPIGKVFAIDQFLETQACTFQYRGIDKSTGRKIRLTFLRPEFARLEDLCEALLDRARIVAQCNHPFVLPILHHEKTSQGPVVVSPYLGPRKLADRLELNPLTPEQIVHFARCLLQGLAVLHEKGLVHGPILPQGVVCTPRFTAQGEITLWDAVLGDAILGPKFLHETIQNGVVPYQSPEQSMGRDIDFRSDWFSLGCVLFELLTGEKAWSLATSNDQSSGTLDAPGLTPSSRNALRPLLQLDPDDRPSNHQAVAELLSQLAAD